MAFQTWKHGKKKRKRKAILLLAYIADVSCLTNRPFYMRILSLTRALIQVKEYLPMGNYHVTLTSIHYQHALQNIDDRIRFYFCCKVLLQKIVLGDGRTRDGQLYDNKV